jgi:hypothetical protein
MVFGFEKGICFFFFFLLIYFYVIGASVCDLCGLRKIFEWMCWVYVLQSNPENTVGILTMAGKGVRVLVTPTSDLGKILACMHG